MKKFIVMLAVLFAIGVKEASAQRITFYYYPTPNVYYNVASHDYLYYDPGTTTWVTVKALPPGIVLTRTRHTVYYNGPQVWRDNASHKTKYKVKKTVIKKNTTKKNNAKGRS
jgi:hypothetical protein